MDGSTKQAPTSPSSTRALAALVSVCAKPAVRMPRHCSVANASVTAMATGTVLPSSAGTSTPAYSPMSTDTAATLPQVAAQSIHPTRNPA